jgi:SAM-dependent methyltransferase
MIDNKETSSEYFTQNAESWLSDAYTQSGYNYPTPFHRLRVVKGIFRTLPDVTTVIDVGCGGGQLAVAIAEMGRTVHGIDQSDEMLAKARELISSQPDEIKTRVTLENMSIDGISESEYDAFTAMGVIGYLPSDEELFNVAYNTLRSNGYFVVSFRNRLFNLFSLSHRTVNEIENGEFFRLYEEACNLYKQVDEVRALEFLQELCAISGCLTAERPSFLETPQRPSEQKGQSYTSEYEARQTTPQEAKQVATKCGFDVIQMCGVHPHLAVPGLNKMLPPQVYNKLCDSLIPLEKEPLAFLWSSVFIGVFQKQK